MLSSWSNVKHAVVSSPVMATANGGSHEVWAARQHHCSVHSLKPSFAAPSMRSQPYDWAFVIIPGLVRSSLREHQRGTPHLLSRSKGHRYRAEHPPEDAY